MNTLDPHASCIQRLVKTNDWAALVRYWLAHQHKPAMRAALGCLQQRVTTKTFQKDKARLLAALQEI